MTDLPYLYSEGNSLPDIACQLNWTEKDVRRELHRWIKKLRITKEPEKDEFFAVQDRVNIFGVQHVAQELKSTTTTVRKYFNVGTDLTVRSPDVSWENPDVCKECGSRRIRNMGRHMDTMLRPDSTYAEAVSLEAKYCPECDNEWDYHIDSGYILPVQWELIS